jgi:hypothetical protein
MSAATTSASIIDTTLENIDYYLDNTTYFLEGDAAIDYCEDLLFLAETVKDLKTNGNLTQEQIEHIKAIMTKIDNVQEQITRILDQLK